MYILCKHMKLKSLVTSLALQQINEVGMGAKQEHVSIVQGIVCTCKIQWYTCDNCFSSGNFFSLRGGLGAI